MLTGDDLDWLQGTSMAIGFQWQTETNPITIVFAGRNDHLHSNSKSLQLIKIFSDLLAK